MNDTPNAQLQTKLRQMIDSMGITQVSRRLGIGREALLRYVGNVQMKTATFRGIEATVAKVDVGTPNEWRQQAGGR